MDITTKESTPLSTDITSVSPGHMTVVNATNGADFNSKIGYLTIGLCGMLDNFIVVYVMIRSSKLRRKSYNILIVNQSLIDFCASFFVIAHAMLRDFPTSTDRVIKDIFCRLWYSSLPHVGPLCIINLQFDRNDPRPICCFGASDRTQT